MKISKKHLRKIILEEFKVLLEEEGDEEEGGEEEAAEEEGGEAEEGGEEAEETKVDTTPEEEAQLSKSADDQILSYIIGFETNAMKSATVASDDQLRPDPDGTPIDVEDAQMAAESKWWKSKLSNVLFENPEEDAIPGSQVSWVGSPDIDLKVFTADVARLVMNYDSLIDMEAHIISKAENYLLDKYDQETADFFIELMDVDHDMRSEDAPALDSQNEVPEPPPALGSGFASQPGGGG